ncbi:MAG: hypothetical protein ABI041_19640 [Bdellovibrionia bacterium]
MANIAMVGDFCSTAGNAQFFKYHKPIDLREGVYIAPNHLVQLTNPFDILESPYDE